MCYGCYEKYGKPTIRNEKTTAAIGLIRHVYELCPVGGNLHIVLDDWNLEDDNLDFCSRQIANGGYEGRDAPYQLEVERKCCDALMSMTIDERASALAVFDGFQPANA